MLGSGPTAAGTLWRPTQHPAPHAGAVADQRRWELRRYEVIPHPARRGGRVGRRAGGRAHHQGRFIRRRRRRQHRPMGRKRLAFEIAKQHEGYYVAIDFTAEPPRPRSSSARCTSPMRCCGSRSSKERRLGDLPLPGRMPSTGERFASEGDGSGEREPIVIVGNLTDDPELRYTPNGAAVVKFRVAVNRRYKDEAGNWKDGDTRTSPSTAGGAWLRTWPSPHAGDARPRGRGACRCAPGRRRRARSARSSDRGRRDRTQPAMGHREVERQGRSSGEWSAPATVGAPMADEETPPDAT